MVYGEGIDQRFGVALVLVVFAVSGCSFGYELVDDTGAGPGGATSRAAALDGTASGGTASGNLAIATGPWGKVSAIEEVFDGSSEDDDPSFTEDLLELYFTSTRGSAAQALYVSHRASADDPWGAPEAVSELNMGPVTAMPAITSDGLAIYFVRQPDSAQSQELYVATRSSRSDNWGAPLLVSCSVAERLDAAPAASSDRLSLVWSHQSNDDDDDDEKGQQLVFSTRASLGSSWSELAPLANVNSDDTDTDPWLSNLGTHLFFASNRSGSSTLFEAVREDAADDFPTASRINNIDRSGNERAPWLNQSQSYLIFAADWDGTLRLYETER